MASDYFIDYLFLNNFHKMTCTSLCAFASILLRTSFFKLEFYNNPGRDDIHLAPHVSVGIERIRK